MELPSIEFSLLEFIFHYVLFLPGNVSHVCRQDSGVTLFREYPSRYLIWNSAAMDVIVTGEGSIISQSVSLAELERDTKVAHNLYFASEKRSTHRRLLKIKRMSIDYRHLVCVHWSWSNLEFWHLSFIFPHAFICKWWRTKSVGTSLLPGLANIIFDSTA